MILVDKLGRDALALMPLSSECIICTQNGTVLIYLLLEYP